MFVIVRRREKCAYVCIQAEWHPGNEQGEWRVDERWWPAASRLPQIQYSIFSILSSVSKSSSFSRWPDRPAPPLRHQRRRLSGILSKLMPYHAGLFHEGVGLG